MFVNAKRDVLWDELRLAPDQQLAALKNGYVIRETHRNGDRYRLRFRVGRNLQSRYLGRQAAKAKRIERLLADARQRQMLADVGNAGWALRHAERLRRQLHSQNAARGRLAHERDHAFDAGQNLNEMEGLTMDDARLASGEDALGEVEWKKENSIDRCQVEDSDGDRWDGECDEDDEDCEREAPPREIEEAEWEHTSDPPQGDLLVMELTGPAEVEEPTVVSSQPEKRPVETVLLDAPVPRHPALIRLDQADEQALDAMDPEEWLDRRLRHQCKEIAYKLVSGVTAKLDTSADPLAAMNAVERPLQTVAKLLKEVNKTEPRKHQKQ